MAKQLSRDLCWCLRKRDTEDAIKSSEAPETVPAANHGTSGVGKTVQNQITETTVHNKPQTAQEPPVLAVDRLDVLPPSPIMQMSASGTNYTSRFSMG